ncbi:hypothetical protein BBJ28_00027060, partial [Nothophytophthora sp. Chile5]
MCCFDPKQRLNIVSVVVRLKAIVKRRDTNRRRLLQTAFKSDTPADRENERMDAHTGGLDTLLQLVQSGVASRQNAATYAMQTFSTLTQGNVLTEQEVLQVVKLFLSDDAKQDWAAIALGYVNCPYSAIRADVTSWLVGLIKREGDGLLKSEAIRAIGYLASDETRRTLIVSHGAIPALLEMVRVGSDTEQAGAARTLGCLAIGCEQNQVAIADAGAIDALVSLIVRGTYQQRIEGGLALRRLAEEDVKIEEIIRDTCWMANCDIGDDPTQRDAARMLREIYDTLGEDESKDKGPFPALVDLMLYGDDQQKNESQTVLYARGHDRKNDRVKFALDPVSILIAFVRVGTAEEKLESERVLGRLADDNDAIRVTIVQNGGIAPLVALVRNGTDSQKEKAAEALGLLAAVNDDIRIAINQEGGIAPLVALMRDGRGSQSEKAAEALSRLADGNDAIRITIVREGGIAPLVAMVLDESDTHTEMAAFALGRLAAGNDATRLAIAREGGIAPLEALVRYGTDSQKVNAAVALGRLAKGNDVTRIAIAQEGGIAPLVALVRDGTNSQKVKAAETLGRLAAGNDANRIAIAQEGGIAPLVALVQDGTNSQKENATYALDRLADDNDANRIAIAQEGGIAPLVALVQDGTNSQKENATYALDRLA